MKDKIVITDCMLENGKVIFKGKKVDSPFSSAMYELQRDGMIRLRKDNHFEITKKGEKMYRILRDTRGAQ